MKNILKIKILLFTIGLFCLTSCDEKVPDESPDNIPETKTSMYYEKPAGIEFA